MIKVEQYERKNGKKTTVIYGTVHGGKTKIALKYFAEIVKNGEEVIFLSGEDSRESLMERLTQKNDFFTFFDALERWEIYKIPYRKVEHHMFDDFVARNIVLIFDGFTSRIEDIEEKFPDNDLIITRYASKYGLGDPALNFEDNIFICKLNNYSYKDRPKGKKISWNKSVPDCPYKLSGGDCVADRGDCVADGGDCVADVGSPYCQRCKYNQQTDLEKKFVICDYVEQFVTCDFDRLVKNMEIERITREVKTTEECGFYDYELKILEYTGPEVDDIYLMNIDTNYIQMADIIFSMREDYTRIYKNKNKNIYDAFIKIGEFLKKKNKTEN